MLCVTTYGSKLYFAALSMCDWFLKKKSLSKFLDNFNDIKITLLFNLYGI